MVSIEQTSKKYRGRKAATYDEIRQKQERWKLEDETVARMLRDMRPRSILDCPVGTGRFIKFYGTLEPTPVVRGIDASEEMLALARAKINRHSKLYGCLTLEVGDARALPVNQWDVAVCVRFLDLIDEAAMRAVVKELCRVARRAVILTIRLGDSYVPKSNTATHDRRRFWQHVARCGWQKAESTPFRDAGWEIIRLERRK